MNMAQVALAVRIASAVDLVCTVMYLVNSVVRWWSDLSEEVRNERVPSSKSRAQ